MSTVYYRQKKIITGEEADKAVLDQLQDGEGGAAHGHRGKVVVAGGMDLGGTTALPGSVAASGKRGGGGGRREFPRLLWDESVRGRGGGLHARRRGGGFTCRR